MEHIDNVNTESMTTCHLFLSGKPSKKVKMVEKSKGLGGSRPKIKKVKNSKFQLFDIRETMAKTHNFPNFQIGRGYLPD